MLKMNYYKFHICSFLMFLLIATAGIASTPVAQDSRIRTLIYSRNEIFRVVLHYGFQTIMEFPKNEEIGTISLGNNYAWQVTPVDNRLFINSLEDDVKTNMTIITNKRTYYFELQSKPYDVDVDNELAYVIRFFYPDNKFDLRVKESEMGSMQDNHIPVLKPYNFDYKLSGSKELFPLQVFDNGTNTFIKLAKGARKPRMYLSLDKSSQVINPSIMGEYYVLNNTFERFVMVLGNKKVIIFNEGYTEADGSGS